MLEPPAGDEAETIRRREALVDFHDLVGTRGTTTTQLTPCGKARFGDLLVDVIADGEVIGRGAAIEVVKVRGSRVLVREVESRMSRTSPRGTRRLRSRKTPRRVAEQLVQPLAVSQRRALDETRFDTVRNVPQPLVMDRRRTAGVGAATLRRRLLTRDGRNPPGCRSTAGS